MHHVRTDAVVCGYFPRDAAKRIVLHTERPGALGLVVVSGCRPRTMLADHSFVFVQIDSPQATVAARRALLAAIARGLRRPFAHASPGPPMMAQRYRRRLPASLRARIRPCR